MEFTVESEEELVERIHHKFSDKLKAPFRVALIGDLGAGKTALVKGLLHKFGVKEPVTSPTFTLCKSYYSTSEKFQHLDLYRYNSNDDSKEIEEYISSQDYVSFVEWPENIAYELKNYDVIIELEVISENSRKVKIKWN